MFGEEQKKKNKYRTLGPLHHTNSNDNKAPFRYQAMSKVNPRASEMVPANSKWNDSARTLATNSNERVDSHTVLLREKWWGMDANLCALRCCQPLCVCVYACLCMCVCLCLLGCLFLLSLFVLTERPHRGLSLALLTSSWEEGELQLLLSIFFSPLTLSLNTPLSTGITVGNCPFVSTQVSHSASLQVTESAGDTHSATPPALFHCDTTFIKLLRDTLYSILVRYGR